MSNNFYSMLGWKGRIGITIPATNAVMEADFNKFKPEGISVYASRIKKDSPLSSVDSNLDMIDYTEEAAQLLTWPGIDINVVGCTAVSFLGGVGSDIALSERLQKSTGIKTITATTALVNALNSLGVKDISIITPYIDEITLKQVNFFKESGFQVINYCGMGLERIADMDKVSPEAIYRFVRKNVSNAEAILISCTTFRGFEAVATLEKDLNIPVVTSNQACLWYALKCLNINAQEIANEAGRLFLVT